MAGSLGKYVVVMSGSIVLLVGGVIAFAGKPNPGEVDRRIDQSSEGLIWRTPQNDGANCLFLQMKLLGSEGTYSQLRDQLPAGNASFADLRHAAEQFGYKAEIFKPEPTILENLVEGGQTLILLMDDPRTGGSSFSLLFSLANDKALMVVGSSVTTTRIPKENLMRYWSGYCLRLQPNAEPANSYLMPIVVSLMIAFLYLAYAFSIGKRSKTTGNSFDQVGGTHHE